MKKELLKLFGLVGGFALLCCIGNCQTTTVSATITDPSSQIWISAGITLNFHTNPSQPNLGIYNQAGVVLNPQQLKKTAITDNSGHFSITGVYDNLTVAPSGNCWDIIIQPLASVLPTQINCVNITGGTQDLSTIINSVIQSPSFPAVSVVPGVGSNAFGYSDNEIHPTPSAGGMYFNTVSLQCRQWNGSTWQNCGTGSSGVGPNPPTFSGQYSNGGTFISTNNVQLNTGVNEQISKLPTVNVLHSDFGSPSGCSNVADPTGVNDSSCAFQAALNYAHGLVTFGSGLAFVYVPLGTYKISSGLNMVSSVYIIGDNFNSTILNFTSGSGVSVDVNFNSVNFAGIQNIGFICPQNATTGCTQGIGINFSTHIRILDSNFNSIGWNTVFTSGNAAINVESSNNINIERNIITQTGGSAYTIVTDGLNGTNPFVESYNVFIKDNKIFNNNSIITIAGFQLEGGQVTGNYIDQNNYFTSPSCGNACGYAILAYERGMNNMTTTGATLNGTNTITVTFPSAQLPTVPTNVNVYQLIIAGVTTCTGTQPNGTFLATQISPTQASFTSTGTTCTSASFNVGSTITPKVIPGRDVISNNNVYNTAGSAIYLQTSHNTSVTGNVIQNCVLQQTVAFIAVGCIAIGGGNNLTLAGNNVICTPGRGEDAETATDVSIQGDNIDMSCALGVNGTAFHANNLQNSNINVVTEGSKQGMLIQASVSGNKFKGTLNDSILDGIAVSDTTATNNDFDVVVNSTVNGNVCSSNIGKSNTFEIQCNGAPIFENGTGTVYKNSSVTNIGSGTAFTVATSTGSKIDNLYVNTAAIGMLYTGAVSDSTVSNSKFLNMSSAALDDVAGTSVNGTFNGTVNVTVASCGPFLNGALLADYTGIVGGGNNWIPIGTTVFSCVGTTLAMSTAATGSGTENFITNGNITRGMNWINNESTGNTPTSQPCLLTHAFQDLVIRGGWCKGYYGLGVNGAIVDIRETTNVLGKQQTISDLLVVGGPLGTDTGIQLRDNATNFRVQHNVVNSTTGFSVGDISTNAFNTFFNNISAIATNFTNPKTYIVNTYVTGNGTYTTATSDTFTVLGVNANSNCGFTATNATAAASTVAAYVSGVGANTVTITHVATSASGGTVNIFCTNN